MILYNSKKEMVAISIDTIDFLGFSSIEEMNEKIEDIADLFINKPGYIYNFKNFSWIDYVVLNHLKKPKVIIKTLTNEVETELIVKELLKIDNQGKMYCIDFKTLSEQKESFEKNEEIPFKGFEEEGFKESFETEIPEIEIKEEAPKPVEEITAETIKTEEPLSVNFDELSIEEPATKETTILDKALKEEKEIVKPLYDTKEVAKELGLDESLIKELLVEFIAQAYELQPQIEEALENEDYELAHNLIHKIKGAAANLRVNVANDILSNTSGINDKNILKEYMDQFYDFIEKLNAELMLFVEKPKIEKKEIQKEQPQIIEPQKPIYKIYNPNIASQELGLSEDIVIEFLKEYITQSLEFKKNFEDYIEKNDLENIKNLAHKLKGSATNLRIEKADEILTKILKSNDIQYLKTLIDNFYKLLDEIAKEFNFDIKPITKTEESLKKNEIEKVIQEASKDLGIEEDIYKEFLNEFIKDLEKIYMTENLETIKKIAKNLKSMSENLRLNKISEILNKITASSDNLEIEKQINELKNIINKLKDI
ncbi:Hpt domain-containing protein [Nitrosophilus kaiyonis]|uniref:Hpt domain-containing protein n=1 Tax=Nitrosophilus kaiyonis TaxID=2930200 RepID=UPI002493BAFF|nr:Hpt domain-containing protein [Nitrosophilus kaiyonis]